MIIELMIPSMSGSFASAAERNKLARLEAHTPKMSKDTLGLWICLRWRQICGIKIIRTAERKRYGSDQQRQQLRRGYLKPKHDNDVTTMRTFQKETYPGTMTTSLNHEIGRIKS